MNKKLTVGYILDPNDVDWLILSIEQVEPIADEIIIIEDGKAPNKLKKLDEFVNGREKFKIIHKKYGGTNGYQYQQLLKHATGDWLLILDADEVPNDNVHLLKEYMNQDKKLYSIRMNHCISNLACIDATDGGSGVNPNYNHYVQCRMFELRKGIYFPLEEHTLIKGFTEEEHGQINDVIIWHYGKAKNMMDVKEKFEMNMERSKMHSKEFLKSWYAAHLLGKYPVKMCDVMSHPSVIRREFHLDELNRGVK